MQHEAVSQAQRGVNRVTCRSGAMSCPAYRQAQRSLALSKLVDRPLFHADTWLLAICPKTFGALFRERNSKVSA